MSALEKRYRINKNLKAYLRSVIERSLIPIRFEEPGTNYKSETITAVTPASSKQFHRMVMRAICEKKSKETGDFYVTQNELDEWDWACSTGRTSFSILARKQA